MQIATAISAKTKIWKNVQIEWPEFVSLIRNPKVQPYTLAEYLALPKTKQGEIKDVGGYVGGYLKGGRRKPEYVSFRSMLSLDIDNNASPDLLERISRAGTECVVHGTFKHHPDCPRYRIIVPLEVEISPAQYEATARKFAGILGIEQFDPTTFQPERMMYWPAVPNDQTYFFLHQQGKRIDPSEYLAMYHDWTDCSEWPTLKIEAEKVRGEIKKQQDPTEKKGIIGAFCRTYSISEAIEKFLPEIYTSTDYEDRYTYAAGEAAAGLIVYDDKYAYSHHGTDPAGGKLCNAFDLVRIHKFRGEDKDSTEAITKLPSYKLMCDLATEDPEVTRVMLDERAADVRMDFDMENEPSEDDWKSKLTRNKAGVESTAQNISLILANDPNLKGKLAYNEFECRRYALRSLPWRKIEAPVLIEDVDNAGVRSYIETVYGVTGPAKVKDALFLEFHKNRFHPVKAYLDSLSWDGVERLDRLMVDYFAADDTLFGRQAIRKTLVGAVARIYEPGCKFDYVLTLVGDQGAGKSTFGRKLCLRNQSWFSDSFEINAPGNARYEQLQGAWISEMAEMSGYKKADVNAAKHFISKQSDSFRPAYAENKQTFFRQGIIIATVNEDEFLRDPTGDRRFWPIKVNQQEANKNIQDITRAEVDQIWAEAKRRYLDGERLYLDTEAEKEAKVVQRAHAERDNREGVIESYLEKRLPDNWGELDLFARRDYIHGEGMLAKEGTTERQYVCTAEIWCECFGKSKEDMSRYNTREINDIMRANPAWVTRVSTRDFGIYGRQKFYERRL